MIKNADISLNFQFSKLIRKLKLFHLFKIQFSRKPEIGFWVLLFYQLIQRKPSEIFSITLHYHTKLKRNTFLYT